MNDPTRVRVLRRFQRYVGPLTALNPDNFSHDSQQLMRQSVLRALATTLLNCPIPIAVLLTAWYLWEDNGDADKFMVLLPVVCSLLRTELMLLAMIWKNGIIVETMTGIHHTTKRRECSFSIAVLDGVEKLASKEKSQHRHKKLSREKKNTSYRHKSSRDEKLCPWKLLFFLLLVKYDAFRCFFIGRPRGIRAIAANLRGSRGEARVHHHSHRQNAVRHVSGIVRDVGIGAHIARDCRVPAARPMGSAP